MCIRDSIWNVEVFAEAPFVTGAYDGGYSGFEVVVDVGGCQVWKWCKNVQEIAMC